MKLKSIPDLGSLPSLLISKHVLRPGLVCAAPGLSTEMHYATILNKTVLSLRDTVQVNSRDSNPIAEAVTSPSVTDLVP